MSQVLHHVGHIFNNLDDGMEFYKNKLGLAPVGVMEMPLWGARIAMFPFAGSIIEAIEPGGLNGDPALRCLKARGEGLFHLSIACDDYDAEVAALRGKGLKLEEYTIPGDTPVKLAFLPPEETHGLWIEFIDSKVVDPFVKHAGPEIAGKDR